MKDVEKFKGILLKIKKDYSVLEYDKEFLQVPSTWNNREKELKSLEKELLRMYRED